MSNHTAYYVCPVFFWHQSRAPVNVFLLVETIGSHCTGIPWLCFHYFYALLHGSFCNTYFLWMNKLGIGTCTSFSIIMYKG